MSNNSSATLPPEATSRLAPAADDRRSDASRPALGAPSGFLWMKFW